VVQRLQSEDDPIGAGVDPKVPIGVVAAHRDSVGCQAHRLSQRSDPDRRLQSAQQEAPPVVLDRL
jgi:hypothetical protein